MGKVVVHNKLIRDNMPKIILSRGARSAVRTLTEDDYKKALLKKLVEEATELYKAHGSVKERVDVAEVLLAIDTLFAEEYKNLENERVTLKEKSGGFEKRLFLESTEELD